MSEFLYRDIQLETAFSLHLLQTRCSKGSISHENYSTFLSLHIKLLLEIKKNPLPHYQFFSF